MVRLLGFLCDFEEDYPSLSEQELSLFRRLFEQGQNNLQAFKEHSPIGKIEPPQNAQKIAKKTTRILFLAADPSDASRLRLGQELRDIRERLQLSALRDAFILETLTSVRPRDISQAFLDFKPNIVHFSGHGTEAGELCFENNLGEVQPVTPQALAALFELVSHEVNCVVMNACYSELQAQAIAKHISFVVGMNKAIGDQAAITFAVGFYKALCAGESPERAFQFARVELQLENIPEELTPVLHQKI
ncbi:CHAT domain-containing protein [Nostoc sp. FACHB-152]|nr:CHAT domain-containing protein [Nostoc sp. FACHB-152]MBD2471913.1 CHAT domain-containing protein [Nostoc sp. FACHB-145]